MPVLVIHGGAGSRALSGERRKIYTQSLTKILREVYPLLERGGSSLDAVTEAVVRLENDPLYNAGRGSKIQSDGKIRMSASIMNSQTRRFGGCVNVEGVKNPILLARALMKKRDRVLAGRGAVAFAHELGLLFASPYTPHQREAFRRRQRGKSGTVGAVAVDQKGVLSAATSTGGRGFEYPQRVSDSPTVAGNFANRFAAISATGTGEEIVENATAAAISTLTAAGWSLEKAVTFVLKQARPQGGEFAVIALDRQGRYVAKSNTPSLLWGAVGSKFLTVFGREV